MILDGGCWVWTALWRDLGLAPDSCLLSLRLSSLHPTNFPPSVLQKKCMEEPGPGAASKWPGAVLGLRTKDHRFHFQKRCTGAPGQIAWSPALWAKSLQPHCHFHSQGLLPGPEAWVKGLLPSIHSLSSVFTCPSI